MSEATQLHGALVLVTQNLQRPVCAGFTRCDSTIQGGTAAEHAARAQRQGLGYITPTGASKGRRPKSPSTSAPKSGGSSSGRKPSKSASADKPSEPKEPRSGKPRQRRRTRKSAEPTAE